MLLRRTTTCVWPARLLLTPLLAALLPRTFVLLSALLRTATLLLARTCPTTSLGSILRCWTRMHIRTLLLAALFGLWPLLTLVGWRRRLGQTWRRWRRLRGRRVWRSDANRCRRLLLFDDGLLFFDRRRRNHRRRCGRLDNHGRSRWSCNGWRCRSLWSCVFDDRWSRWRHRCRRWSSLCRHRRRRWSLVTRFRRDKRFSFSRWCCWWFRDNRGNGAFNRRSDRKFDNSRCRRRSHVTRFVTYRLRLRSRLRCVRLDNWSLRRFNGRRSRRLGRNSRLAWSCRRRRRCS